MSRFSPAASLAGRRKESPHEDNIKMAIAPKAERNRATRLNRVPYRPFINLAQKKRAQRRARSECIAFIH